MLWRELRRGPLRERRGCRCWLFPAVAERYPGLTAPGLAGRRGTGQSREQRGERGRDHWGVCGGKPVLAGVSQPDVGSEGRLRLALQGLWLGCSVSRAPGRGGRFFSPGSVTAALKGGHLRLLALPSRNRGAAGAPRRGRVGRSMAAWAGGSRCGSPLRLEGRSSRRAGLGR